jgi:hypothetical protein
MVQTIYPNAIKSPTIPLPKKSEEQRLSGVLLGLIANAELAGKITPEDARKLRNEQSHDPREGKKLRQAFIYAVEKDRFTQSEADELQGLLGYRNDVAHRLHEIMADISRSHWNRERLEFRPSAYKTDALDRLRSYRESLWKRARGLVVRSSLNGLKFELAEQVYKEDLSRLETLISMQIEREDRRLKKIYAELNLNATELQGELHPQHLLNFYQNGFDGGPNTGHLTKRGAEICYRLFDLGKSPIAVAYLMGISLQAAKRREKRWKEAGGVSRQRLGVWS